jgi:glycosyltransferase involved in cell wall biosynthesis
MCSEVPPLAMFGPPQLYVPEEILPGLVAGARALLYPSLSEGFGLPPLESMAAGVPVLASDRGSIPEVVADAALLAPPDDEEGFASAIVRISRDENLRADLARRGRERARRFTPERVAGGWAEVHEEAARWR